MKKIRIIVAAGFLCILFLCSCDTDSLRGGETYTSPEGTNTIIIEYDWVSRPEYTKRHGMENQKYDSMREAVLWKQSAFPLIGLLRTRFVYIMSLMRR